MNDREPRSGRSLLLTGIAGMWSSLRGNGSGSGDGAGLLLMVLSAALFSFMAALAKLFLPAAPTEAIVLSRGLVLTAFFAAMARSRGISLLGQRRGKLLLRGLLGAGAVWCYFYSVQHLPLGDAVLIQYSHPVFVAMVAPWLLREPTGRGHWPLVLIALLGVALIVGPSADFHAAALVGLTGTVLSGLAYMTVRDLARTEHALTILVWFPAVTIPVALPPVLHTGRACLPQDGREWLGHALVILFALLGQWAMTKGLARAAAARATAVTMCGPIFGLLFGWLFFETLPTLWSALGTATVVVALAWLALGKPATPALATAVDPAPGG